MKQVFVTTAFAIASAALVFGCASETTGPSSETGSVGVNLLVGDTDVKAVSFELVCDSGFALNGQFNVNDEQDPPIWAAIMDVPVPNPETGEPCSMVLIASDAAGNVLCTGEQSFVVEVSVEPVKVDVVLLCGDDGDDPLGNIDIDATFEIVEGNNCPRLHFLNAVPDEVPAEGSEVTVWVSDKDDDTLTTQLTAGSGSFGQASSVLTNTADPVSVLTTYSCAGAAGGQMISVTVTDGDTACDKSKSFDVTCPGVDPCDGVVCEDDGNVCTDAECNPATGQCETSNNTNECTAGGGGELAVNGDFETGNLDGWVQFCTENNGTCEATTAESNGGAYSANLVASVPEGGPASFPLIKNANIGIGTVTPNSPISISFDLKGELTGVSGQVVAEFFSEQLPEGTSKSEILGILIPTSEWVTYSFETTTGPVVDNGVTLQLKVECGAVPGCGNNSYFDNVSVVFGSGGEPGTCNAGVCVPNAECSVPDDCPATGNECIDPVCDAGTCGTSNNTNACDDGNGTCDGQGNCVSNIEALYEQSFDGLPVPPESIFITDDWQFFNFVFDSNGGARFDYSGPAPNGPQICALVNDQGGPEQGTKQLTVYSDYNCCGGPFGHQLSGDSVQVNVFRELTITAADLNKTLEFSFDAKRGNINDPNAPLGICDPTDPGYTINPPCDSTALAFVKTIDSGGNLTNERVIDTTNLPVDWTRVTVPSLDLTDPALEGQTLQVGFQTTAESFEPSGNFYDNVLVTVE